MNLEDFEADLWIGREMGKYKVESLLGSGGAGAVYLAFEIATGKRIALKILSLDLLGLFEDTESLFFEDLEAIRNFHHPNSVRILDFGKQHNTCFIVMDYVSGRPLDQVLEESAALPLREAVCTGIEMTDVLEAAHRKGILHLGIKPGNIILDRKGSIKLVDWGLGKWVNRSACLSTSSQKMKTPLYQAPEYIMQDDLDRRVDLYSLGTVLFHVLSGDPPYIGRTPLQVSLQHIQTPVPSIRVKHPEIPQEIDFIVKKLMAKKPEGRFANASEAGHALREFLAGLPADKQLFTFPDTKLMRMSRPPKQLDARRRKNKVSVLVVDDSPTMCKSICSIFADFPVFEIAGVCYSGREALESIPELAPDVITLDINMPEMDGLTTLKNIMSSSPKAVIMLSAFSYEGAWITMNCLSTGAVDFIWKSSRHELKSFSMELAEKTRRAAQLELHVPKTLRVPKLRASEKQSVASASAEAIVVMDAGEGGYSSYLKIIPYIPRNIPCAIIAVQETDSSKLSDILADYLNEHSRIQVKRPGCEILQEGTCYLTNNLESVKLEREQRSIRILTEESLDKKSTFDQIISALSDRQKYTSLVLSGNKIQNRDALQKFKQGGGTVLVQKPETCMDPTAPNFVIQNELADKIILDVDIPSVLWHFLKR